MIIAISMNVSDIPALKKSYLLCVSFTYSSWTFKELTPNSLFLI